MQADGPNAEQIGYWNNRSGKKWANHSQQLDVLFDAITNRLLELAEPISGTSVLEIGCGTGSVAAELSDRVGEDGHVLGIDISDILLSIARLSIVRQQDTHKARTNVQFQLADAQIYPFEPQSIDLVVSRFGVMFFADPVAAFANILSATKPNARTVFAAWALPTESPWFNIPYNAAVARFGTPTPKPKNAPGPTAFADAPHVVQILQAAGFTDAQAKIETIPLTFKGSAKQAATLACSLGSAVRLAKEKGAVREDMEILIDEVAPKFEEFAVGGQIIVPAKINYFTCRTP